MKKVVIIILFLLCNYVTAQEFVIDSTQFEHNKFEAGYFFPLGNLKTKIGISDQYGFWYRSRIEHNDLLDVGCNIIIPNIKNTFVYQGQDSIFNVKAKGITIMIGCRVNKLYPIVNKKAILEWSSGFGASFFSFEDKEHPEDTSGYYEDEDGNKSYHIDTNTKSLNSLYVSQGIVLTSKKIGVQINYNFIPYNWFTKRIENDFGKSSLSLFLSYKL